MLAGADLKHRGGKYRLKHVRRISILQLYPGYRFFLTHSSHPWSRLPKAAHLETLNTWPRSCLHKFIIKAYTFSQPSCADGNTFISYSPPSTTLQASNLYLCLAHEPHLIICLHLCTDTHPLLGWPPQFKFNKLTFGET